jgi:thiamine biosynthesis lipoprotein
MLAIESELAQINAWMSTYDPESTLSRFNRAPVGEWIEVDAELITVLDSALTLSRESSGAFDVTVGPLVNAWGFGPVNLDGPDGPSADELAALLTRVGYQLLEIRSTPAALRKTADIYVDLSAIAKGFGVDRVAQLLQQSGCQDFLVDIGGEVRVRGVNPAGKAWRIGIEVPDPDSQGGIQRILALHDQAVATSGDYRNFRDLAGHRISHTIDPRTGRPVEHGLASVTVVHESAMWADGYATAINVLGPQAGFALAEAKGLSALLITRSPDGYQERYTSGLSHLIVQP